MDLQPVIINQPTEDNCFAPWQFIAINNPFEHFADFGGIGTGKTYTGAHFAIDQIRKYPHLTGFIGANTYDQLSQVTLREFFYWLDFYGFEWVADCRPPLSWGAKKQFKKHNNIVSVRTPTGVVTVFTRVLGRGFRLRGLEFSWYWLDETRDTPRDTHDIILSRMRESTHRKGLITTTTNGEDWVWERFYRDKDNRKYGCMHVTTKDSVDFGILTPEFYETLIGTYDEPTANQELHAKHVIIIGLPVYRSYGTHNELSTCPFTKDGGISPYLPIILAMDFNLSPMCWTLGQQRGDDLYWHDEIVLKSSHTQEATLELIERVKNHKPGVILCGDATSKAGQRAAAGKSDYDIICSLLDQAGIKWENKTPDSNPMVKDRVNNVNAKWRTADGSVHMWHSPKCKNLKRDSQNQGWKAGAQYTLDPGKLNDIGHSADGVGYAVSIMSPIPSAYQTGGLRVVRRT